MTDEIDRRRLPAQRFRLPLESWRPAARRLLADAPGPLVQSPPERLPR